MTAAVAPATTPRVWRMVVPAPCLFISANDDSGSWAVIKRREQWRNTTHLLAVGRRLPKGLARVRIDVELHFRDRRPRDEANYHATAKPVVDALGPPFIRPPTRRRPKGAAAPGYGLIADDTPAHLDGPHVTVGRLWREVAAELPIRDSLRRARPGGITVLITDLSHEEELS